MSFEAFLFILAVLAAALLLFAMVYTFILYTDLESDHVNPIDFCKQVNKVVVPEIAAHGILTTVFLLSMSWIAFFMNIPLLAWNIRKVLSRKYLHDATNVYAQLDFNKREGLIKLVFYLLSFFYYLYRMILGLLEVN